MDGIAAIVALGTDWLALRLDDLPADVEADRDAYGESPPIGPGWHVVSIWEGRLRELAAAALLHAVNWPQASQRGWVGRGA